MKIQLLKSNNYDHFFYVAYIQPLKAGVQASGKYAELSDWELPKGATIFVDGSGVEHVYYLGEVCEIVTDVETGVPHVLVPSGGWEEMCPVGKTDGLFSAKVIEFPVSEVA
jgi:hypothetical protein